MDRDDTFVADLERDLSLSTAADRFDDRRIALSWKDPARFERALIAAFERGGARLASSLDRSIALYADGLLRHRAARNPAIEHYDERAGWTSVSYAALESEAARLASLWAARGVNGKSVIALALDPQPLLFAACFAAWRLGAAVTVVPSAHPASISRALAACGATAVVLDNESSWPLDAQWSARQLPLRGMARLDAAPPIAIPAEQPAIVALSPLGAPSKPSKVSAREALLCALRDAVLSLSLAPGRRVAAPMISAAQCYPTLALAAFCAGATLVLWPSQLLRSRPELMTDVALDTVLLGPALIDAIEARGAVVGRRWTRVLRCVEASLDWSRVHRFVRAQCASATLANVLYDAGAGGAILRGTSLPSSVSSSVSSRVLPVPGRSWKLAGPQSPAAGVLDAKGASGPVTETPFVLASQGTELLYAGTLDARRDGHAYDCDAALASLGSPPFLRGAAWVIDAVDPCTARFSLVCFCDRIGDAPRWIGARIERDLGPSARPDAIVCYRGAARRKGARTDGAWVAAQQRAGWLQQKQRLLPFRAVAALREHARSLREER